jgi:hypothetical protein
MVEKFSLKVSAGITFGGWDQREDRREESETTHTTFFFFH